MKVLTTVSVMLLCLLAACDMGGQRRFDRDEWIEEYENRQPKRIKPGQIMAQLQQEGEALGKAIQELGLQDTASCCPGIEAATLDSLNRVYEAEMNCFALEAALPDKLDSVTYALLDAYKYSLEQGQELAVGYQKTETGYIYTLPQTKACPAVWVFTFTTRHLVNNIE